MYSSAGKENLPLNTVSVIICVYRQVLATCAKQTAILQVCTFHPLISAVVEIVIKDN